MRRAHSGPVLVACLVLLSGFIVVAATARLSWPASASSGFVSETIADGLSAPTDFAFAPDGRIFITEKSGAVRIFKDGELVPDPFVELTVNRFHERGLLGLALDSQFDTNGYVYLYYVVENSPDSNSGPKTAQLLRVTADGDVALPGSGLAVLGTIVGDPSQPSCSDFPVGTDCIPADGPSHNGGGLRFASDGTLLLSIGDAEQFWPAQDLDSLSGKIVRINPDGSAPPENPFFTGDPQAVRSKVWAYGLRNPFRFGVQPGSDLPFIADVGSSWEEINVGTAGANFGWPCYSNTKPERGGQLCQKLDAAGTATPPLYAYSRESGAAVMAGVFYQGVNYPALFQDAFFFGDYVRNSISSLKVDAENNLIPGSVTEVILDADGPVDFEIGPEGNVYYLSINTGELRRIRYVTITPTITPTETPTPTATPTPSSIPTAQGDVDCDDVANVVDALFILQYEVALRVDGGGCPLPPPPPDTLNASGGDVNKDGPTNVVDALFILQCEVGLKPGANMPFCAA
jgi:glucose/arabinose dehydrogenase